MITILLLLSSNLKSKSIEDVWNKVHTIQEWFVNQDYEKFNIFRKIN